MGSTRGKRVPGKKKPKSIKAKVSSKMSSKRRLSRMGKEMKKGQKGIVANYMTRSQVLRRLQVTLRDFRCVWLSLFLTVDDVTTLLVICTCLPTFMPPLLIPSLLPPFPPPFSPHADGCAS